MEILKCIILYDDNTFVSYGNLLHLFYSLYDVMLCSEAINNNLREIFSFIYDGYDS